MRIKKSLQLGLASIISVSSLLTAGIPLASAATATWDGGGSDANLTTAANWLGDVAPTAGDDLIFPMGAGVTVKDVTNDFAAGTSFNSIVFFGAPGTGEASYEITGNSIDLVAGVGVSAETYATIELPIEFTADQSLNVATNALLYMNGSLSGASNITKIGTGYLGLGGDANTLTGNIVVSAGILDTNSQSALGTAAGSTTVNDGASIFLSSDCDDSSVWSSNEPLIFNGNPATGFSKLNVGRSCAAGGGGTIDDTYGYQFSTDETYTVSGPVTLGADVTFGAAVQSLTFSGALSGSGKLVRDTANKTAGKLIVEASSNTSGTPNGTYAVDPETVTLSDDQATRNILINSLAVVTLNGKRGEVYVGKGGTLKGTGTTGVLNVASGGTVAPGNSPGCLNSGDLNIDGIYQFEIGGTAACSGYDQIKVTGTVSLATSTSVIQTSVVNGFVPAVGQSYTIIDNDGSDAVTGTFKDLAQGAAFTSNDGVTYSVSYTGGDGNDVVITVTAVDASKLPKAPATGIKLVAAHPLAMLSFTLLATGALVIAARRFATVTIKK